MNGVEVARIIERRARAQCSHKGQIPSRIWRDAISEYLGPLAPASEAERVNRVVRQVLTEQLVMLEREAREQGWP